MQRPNSIRDLWNGNITDAVRLTAKRVEDSLNALDALKNDVVAEVEDE